MSYSLNSSKGVFEGILQGTTVRVNKGDTILVETMAHVRSCQYQAYQDDYEAWSGALFWSFGRMP